MFGPAQTKLTVEQQLQACGGVFSGFDEGKGSVKLICPKNGEHKLFLRKSYDDKGAKVNVELVDEYGRFLDDQLDLYTGNVRYKYICSDCEETAIEMN